MRRAVVMVRPSPLNDQRWNVEFSCGHEVWVTRKSRPKAATMICPDCDLEAKDAERSRKGGSTS